MEIKQKPNDGIFPFILIWKVDLNFEFVLFITEYRYAECEYLMGNNRDSEINV